MRETNAIARLVADGADPLKTDGNKLTFQVNYLSHYLLTRLLMDRLTVSGNSRVINLSSVLHLTANLNWSDPQRTKSYSPVPVYAQSKLAMSMFARSLSTKEPRVNAVSVHPGIVETDLLTLYTKPGGDPARISSRRELPAMFRAALRTSSILASTDPEARSTRPIALAYLRSILSRTSQSVGAAPGAARELTDSKDAATVSCILACSSWESSRLLGKALLQHHRIVCHGLPRLAAPGRAGL